MPQDSGQASYAPKLTKADGRIRWQDSARAVHAQVRGVTPWPGAHSLLSLLRCAEGGQARELALAFMPGKIGAARPSAVPSGSLWVSEDGSLNMVCQDALYVLNSLRPADRSFMPAADFVRGFLPPGARGICGHAL